jgi:hypothetical protein
MSIAVVFVKITDDKKNGIIFQGPSVSAIKDTRAEAEEEARRIVNESRNCTVIPRLYEIQSTLSVESVLTDARQFFSQMYDNMIDAKKALARPIRRKKRRKARPKTRSKAYDLES